MEKYLALYRKYRPSVFSDIVGQENISKILKHQITSGQIGHAYLFCGSKGTGKTSTAKILSRAVNCLTPINGEPCNSCAVCENILSSASIDVLEIDAASNNGVDNIRSIREDVIYSPTLAKYKVYIIDEVHMLSSGAFNALLKTLEEPPSHVIFILATTEPHKIPVTILSRCQRFEFKRISLSDISNRLKFICQDMNISYDSSALDIIAASAEGALRDAISILDQVISSNSGHISQENIKDILGIPSSESLFSLASAILKFDTPSAVKTLKEIIESGKDTRHTIWQLTLLFRDALIYRATSDSSLLNNFSSVDRVSALSSFDESALYNAIITFSELDNKIKFTTFPEILLETTIIKLSTPATTIKVPPASIPSSKPAITKAPKKNPEKPLEKQPVAIATTNVSSFEDWSKILNVLKSSGKVMLYGALVSTSATVAGSMLTISFPRSTSFGKSIVEKPENLSVLKKVLKENTDTDFNVKCEIKENSISKSSPIEELENRLKKSDISVTIEE